MTQLADQKAREFAREVCQVRGGGGPDRMTPAMYTAFAAAGREATADVRAALSQAVRFIDASYWLHQVGVERRAWEVTEDDLQLLRATQPWKREVPPSRRTPSTLIPLEAVLPHTRPR